MGGKIRRAKYHLHDKGGGQGKGKRSRFTVALVVHISTTHVWRGIT